MPGAQVAALAGHDDATLMTAGVRVGTVGNSDARTVNQVLAESQVLSVIDELEDDLVAILAGDKNRMVAVMHYCFGPGRREVVETYPQRRKGQPHFAHARSVRNALDLVRLLLFPAFASNTPCLCPTVVP